jgi:hypothetical protein
MKKIFLTVYCQGGLGNQLFQFIIGYILAKKNNIKLRLDIERFNSYNRKFELNNFPNIKKMKIPIIKNYNLIKIFFLFFYPKILKILKILKIFNILNSFIPLEKEKLEESPFIFNKNLLNKKFFRNTTISGFFQSEKYFVNYKKEVLNLFKFPLSNNKVISNYLNIVKKTNSIAIHIRRGDYITNSNARRFHGILPYSYYKNALRQIKSKVSKPTIFIFSDDIESVKKNFLFLNDEKCIFVYTNSSIQDLHIMSNCKYFIIANSSFSWWGAWLSNYKKKIVYSPKKWVREKILTKDILPRNWKKISFSNYD